MFFKNLLAFNFLVKLKRRLQYKSSALSLNVRPYKILQAANWLTDNSNLYREQGISFSEDRVASCNINLQNETESEDITQATMGDKSVETLCHFRVLKANFFSNLYNTTPSPLLNVEFPVSRICLFLVQH